MGACLCSTGACTLLGRGASSVAGRPARLGAGACSVGTPVRSGRLLGRGACSVGAPARSGRLARRRSAQSAPGSASAQQTVRARSAPACSSVGACSVGVCYGRRLPPSLLAAWCWSARAEVGVCLVGACRRRCALGRRVFVLAYLVCVTPCDSVAVQSARASYLCAFGSCRGVYKYSRTCVTSFERGFGWQATRLAVIKKCIQNDLVLTGTRDV